MARRTFEMIDLIEIYVHGTRAVPRPRLPTAWAWTVRRFASTWHRWRRRVWFRVGRR